MSHDKLDKDDLKPSSSGAIARNDLADVRRSYNTGMLLEEDCESDPLDQFRKWMEDALAIKVNLDPTAMILATTDAEGMPRQRTVLLKGFDERGFCFFTNLDSAKGREIRTNPQVCLLFPWLILERQVIIQGQAQRLDREADDTYFHSRPRESQLGALASRQSEAVSSRTVLDKTYEETVERFAHREEIELPENWGGYRIVPSRYEFWQGRRSRLHDRIEYSRREPDGWRLTRLQP
ncbi:pyridoxamine 5'-phosphate oxidase [Allohahella marinimesophila]|uniref:Pyridoxine/pyridoxamine 5'-phosphate oxidase n=1 Tax=Allohahella marinimesophila TaxID=1054972 RepID=A0ABP7NV43_9GAMM